MNKQNLNFFNNEIIQIDLLSFFLSFVTVAILCFLIQLFYIRFATTLSNRSTFSKNFVAIFLPIPLLEPVINIILFFNDLKLSTLFNYILKPDDFASS